MEILNIKLSELNPYKSNPRNNDAAVGPVAESIQNFGFKVPLVIDKNKIIVCGHTRYRAAQKLGLEEVPCIMADDLNEEQIKAFRLADNKTAEFAQWDISLLAQELSDISKIDMEKFGFDISALGMEDPEEIIEDTPPEVPKNPKSKAGELYQLGRHRLLCGDSTKAEDVALLMGDTAADLVITDPPYNVGLGYDMDEAEAERLNRRKDGLTIKNDKFKSDESFVEFLQKAFENILTSLRPGGAFYIWYAAMQQHNFIEATQRAKMEIRQQLIWNKNALVLSRQDYQWKHEPCLYGWREGAAHYFTNSRLESTVIPDANDVDSMSKAELKELCRDLLERIIPTTVINEKKPTRSAQHPTMKPVGLFAYLIKNSSKRGEVVLDLFGGSGTTLVAAEQLGRTAYIMEYDPQFVDVIIERWETLTGGKAEKIN